MWRARVIYVMCAMGLLVAPVRVWSQERGGTIAGSVNDAGRYVLPGARVELESRSARPG
jgi:hypothetical protein